MNLDMQDDLRTQLEWKYLFLKFVGNLVTPEQLYDNDSRILIDKTENYVYHPIQLDFLGQFDDISHQLDKLIAEATGVLPLKLTPEEIAKEFKRLLNEEGKKIYRNGVPFGWLNNFIDCTYLKLPSDLPYHARIGLWIHAGYFNVEERFLLEDAFFLLEIANVCYNKLLLAASQTEEYGILGKGNQNVGSAARLCIFSFYAFVEAFVNSIGSDFVARNFSKLIQDDIEILHGNGKKRGQYLSLEKKMESFPKIIRPDKTSPIVLTDKKQQKEPFLTFLSNIKEVRDASAHFGVGKASIWRKPEEWLNFAELTSTIAVEVASKFWEACYPGKSIPDYLYGLKYDAWRESAQNRLDTTEYILTQEEE